MSKVISSIAISGAQKVVGAVDSAVRQVIADKGSNCPVGFPDTAYYLPVIYSLLGHKVETLGDMLPVLDECKSLLAPPPSESAWLPYFGSTLDAGMATLFAAEMLEACKYLIGPSPVDGIWLGAASDVIIRERGIEFVDGSAPGFAAIVGAAPDVETAVKIARELQEKNIYVFMAGETGGISFAEQLVEDGVEVGWDTRLVPFGKDVSAAVYALGFANRAALSFGGVQPGDYARNLKYNKDRIFAFVMALGAVDEIKCAAAAGALSYGFPIIADTAIPQILPSGVCTYEHIVSNVPLDQIVEKALEVRGCKIKITKVPIPVTYGAAFEGERVRKEQTHVEFGGNRTPAFEYVTTKELDEVQDGKIEVVGPDVDDVEPGTALPLGIWVEVAGRKMQPDFESILERQIHHLINGAEGIWHMGQRDIIWVRISKNAKAKGFTIAHLGEILHAKLLNEYPAIVDKVQVTLFTDKEDVKKRLAQARRVYRERNLRVESMTDETVDTFYSCLLCQSFAPNHVCVITPERLGLCGAYNWLDGKAAYEIDPTGPNQPLVKGECLDPIRGQWKNINDYVYQNSKQTIKCFNAYSMLKDPMTSCGCFEAIVAMLPECNGVAIVSREYPGNTPMGMKFSTLAGMIGGGIQTPGFIGVGKAYISSRKFISSDGGHKRIVWMPKELKDSMREELLHIGEQIGIPEFIDMIADETVAMDDASIRAYMEKVSHPALDMWDITQPSPEAAAWDAKKAAAPVAERKPVEPVKDAPVKTAVPVGKPAAAVTAAPVVVSDAKMDGDLLIKMGGDLRIATPSQSAKIVMPGKFSVPGESVNMQVRTVTLGGSGTRTSAVTIGGASAFPFRHFEGDTGCRQVVAMEVFDQVSPKLPESMHEAYGSLLENPAEMAKYCVEELGAEAISVRLDGTHPDNGDKSPDEAAKVVESVLKAVGVPIIVTGPGNYDKMNDVMKQIAGAFAGENLLLNWAETDNYKTLTAAAMGYGHCVVSQTPIDVNMAKQLNILMTNMGIAPEKIMIDALTGAIGYGLEYTYSVMERIRTSAFTGDAMLAMPMLGTPGSEVAKTKESKAPQQTFPLWGSAAGRGALLEIATAMSLLNAGADLLIMYHPIAAKTVKNKIAEMNNM
ncbi:MAG: acetyl-CoA decarbonylase/synthase complex subunit alpha/beta [Armatimonadota bacterium]